MLINNGSITGLALCQRVYGKNQQAAQVALKQVSVISCVLEIENTCFY